MARKQQKIVNIDLTDEVNANWRDRLRVNPHDPAYAAPVVDGEPIQAIDVEPVARPEVRGALKDQIKDSIATTLAKTLKP